MAPSIIDPPSPPQLSGARWSGYWASIAMESSRVHGAPSPLHLPRMLHLGTGTIADVETIGAATGESIGNCVPNPRDRVFVLKGPEYPGYPVSVKKSPVTPTLNARWTWLELWGNTDIRKLVTMSWSRRLVDPPEIHPAS
ncbi:hypothetical protein N7448_004548 [Penicillium atrosanguineum]|nr:hypothetical protein N7448_004548 [Penicillium atrosanguineum]